MRLTKENEVQGKQKRAKWCPPHERTLHELKPRAPFDNYHPRHDSYYAKTAYSADKAHAPRDAINTNEEYPRQRTFKRLPANTRITGEDYIGNSGYTKAYQREPKVKSQKDDFIKIQPSVIRQSLDTFHTMYLASSRNIAKWFYLLAVFGYGGLRFFTWFIIFGTILAFVLGTFNSWNDLLDCLMYIVIWMLGSFTAWKVFAWIGYKMPDNKYRKLKRRTGMVCIPQKGKLPDKEIPFAEFEPRIMLTTSSKGLSSRLAYVHQSGSPTLYLGQSTKADVYTRAALVEQFMDITRPLPDIPSWEWCRDKDPTTKAFDETTGRPSRYWRDKSNVEIQEIRDATSDKVGEILGKGSLNY